MARLEPLGVARGGVQLRARAFSVGASQRLGAPFRPRSAAAPFVTLCSSVARSSPLLCVASCVMGLLVVAAACSEGLAVDFLSLALGAFLVACLVSRHAGLAFSPPSGVLSGCLRGALVGPAPGIFVGAALQGLLRCGGIARTSRITAIICCNGIRIVYCNGILLSCTAMVYCNI